MNNDDLPEVFQPIAVRAPHENWVLFWIRCFFDLQLLTIFRFLVEPLSRCKGRVLDVGAGESPWRELLPSSVEYFGVDADSSCEFGMRQKSDVTYYDGIRLPFEEESFDHVLCTEVLEHVSDPAAFICDLNRVLRKGGTLILTVPWSARLHHLPYDYSRLTRFGLASLLESAGLIVVTIEERGNDVAVIANKLLVLMIRLLRPHHWHNFLWSWILAISVAPVVIGFLFAAHATLLLRAGSSEDPLGYGVVAVKACDRV